MEVALRRLSGVDKVSISIPKQQVVVLYKPGTMFQPKDLRSAVKQSDVTVKQFHIQAQGQIETGSGKQFFVAGKDRFAVASAPPKIPAGSALDISADANDKVTPIEIKITDFKPVPKK